MDNSKDLVVIFCEKYANFMKLKLVIILRIIAFALFVFRSSISFFSANILFEYVLNGLVLLIIALDIFVYVFNNKIKRD